MAQIGHLRERTNKVHQAITVPILPPCINKGHYICIHRYESTKKDV